MEIIQSREILSKKSNESLIYFPAYRRIEEELGYLGIPENDWQSTDASSNLIQFGMKDVANKISLVESNLKDSSVELFSKVTGEILIQFIEGLDITQDMKDSIQSNTLDIVLRRVGEKNISVSDRDKIKKLLTSGQIYNPEHGQLVYFLSKLISLYEQQKEKERGIKKFIETCNHYLESKNIIYDEAEIEISIVQLKDSHVVDLDELSSGEKQIIALFSKIYLDEENDFLLLFDEPELSLSIEWQRLLLPDILKSGRCKLLLAATHSPFIFDNELDQYADDLDSFVSEA